MCRAASFVGLLTAGIPAWATIALVFLLGASVSVPYYVPLPAFNIRRGGAFSAVLEGGKAAATRSFHLCLSDAVLVGAVS